MRFGSRPLDFEDFGFKLENGGQGVLAAPRNSRRAAVLAGRSHKAGGQLQTARRDALDGVYGFISTCRTSRSVCQDARLTCLPRYGTDPVAVRMPQHRLETRFNSGLIFRMRQDVEPFLADRGDRSLRDLGWRHSCFKHAP